VTKIAPTIWCCQDLKTLICCTCALWIWQQVRERCRSCALVCTRAMSAHASMMQGTELRVCDDLDMYMHHVRCKWCLGTGGLHHKVHRACLLKGSACWKSCRIALPVVYAMPRYCVHDTLGCEHQMGLRAAFADCSESFFLFLCCAKVVLQGTGACMYTCGTVANLLKLPLWWCAGPMAMMLRLHHHHHVTNQAIASMLRLGM
jgi:hypothetical protein